MNEVTRIMQAVRDGNALASAELVKLRFFAGLTVEQAAVALKISRATADRYWAFARAWLFHEISSSTAASNPSEPPNGGGG